MDALALARIQFAANISFHILFPTITIALGWFLLCRYRAIGDKSLNGLARLGAIGAWAMVGGAFAAFLSKALGGF